MTGKEKNTNRISITDSTSQFKKIRKPELDESTGGKSLNSQKLREKTLLLELKQSKLELQKSRAFLKEKSTQFKIESEARNQKLKILEDVISCAGGPVFSVDKNYCYTSFNNQHAKTMKFLYGAVIKNGNSLLDYHSNSQDRKLAKKYLDRALKGETVLVESYAGDETKSRHYFEIAHYPLRDQNNKVKGVTVYARDITGLKIREEENKQIARTLKTLSNSNQTMMRATNESEYMQEVCRNIENDCGYAMVWIGLAENDKHKSIRPVISAGIDDGYLEKANISWADNGRGRGPTGTAIRTGKVSLCRNMLTDPKFAPWRSEALKHGYASSIALPLIAGDKPFGALTIYSKMPDAFTSDEVNILSELASDLAYGITAFKLRVEQAKAEEVKTWLSSFPELNPTPVVEVDYYGNTHYLNPAARQMFPDLLARGWEHPFLLGLDEIISDFQNGETGPTVRDIKFGESYYRQTLSCIVDSERIRIYSVDITARINAEQALRVARDELETRVQERTLELVAYRLHLEDLVNERTGQLVSVNDLLQEEITERMHVERDLNVERGNLQMIFDVVNVGMLLLDRDGLISRANRVVSKWTGKNPGEIQGNQPGDALGCIHAVTDQVGCGNSPYCNSCLIRNAFETAMRTGQPVHDIEVESILFQDSTPVQMWLDLNADPFVVAGENHVVLSMNDITQRKRAQESLREARDGLEVRVQDRTKELIAANEQLHSEARERKRVELALRESEERYRTLFETSPDAVMLVDMNNKIIFANQRAVSMHGYRNPKSLAGVDISSLIASKDSERVREAILSTVERGALREIEYLILKKDGSQFPAELNVSVVRSDNDRPTGYLMDVRDITERKWAEESLRSAYAYNRSLIEASLDPLVTITMEGKIGDVNRATEVVTGYSREELIGTDFHGYFSDPEKAQTGYQKVFDTGTVRDYNLEIRNKDGSLIPVLYNSSVFRDETGNVKGVFAAARDITERNRFETQLVQAEKHAVIGRMVGSITHEINNPLQTIKNCLYLLQQDVTPGSPLQEPLEMATSETLRLTNLVGHLRELYRPKVGINKQSNEILDILEEVHSLLIPHLNSAKVHWQPLPGLQRFYINCVRDQILEVFLNISMNAIEAMQGNGGTLFVDMVKSEDRVGVIIKDTGPGIPEDIAQHIFEPFMTTKASGLGLGLSISYGIVQRHGGQITLENQPGQGASFIIWLPQTELKLNEENG